MDRLLEYISHHPWYAAGAAVAALLVIAYELRTPEARTSFAVSPQDVVRLMNQGALVIDLRPADAFANGHVAGAKQMSGEQILKAGDTLKKQKEKVVVVYDDTGSLGAVGRAAARRPGFHQGVQSARRHRRLASREPAALQGMSGAA